MDGLLFRDRTEAGQKLAGELARYRDQPDVLVLALPRGGVPVAYEVAKSLNAHLDVFVVRKLGVPGQKELAMGAIATGGVRVINYDVVGALGIPGDVIGAVATEEQREVERREHLYRQGHPRPSIQGQIVILVDDGIATGSTIKAAIAALQAQHPARLVVAVPVAPASAREELRLGVDEFVCLEQPEFFYAVGQWYQDFRQISDEEVQDLLRRAWERKIMALPPGTGQHLAGSQSHPA
jgi:putative phosphoribosyl transferase